MRAHAHLFDGKPSGLNILNVLRGNPHLTALRAAINEAVIDDFSAAREAVRVGHPAAGQLWHKLRPICQSPWSSLTCVAAIWLWYMLCLHPACHQHLLWTLSTTHSFISLVQENDVNYRKIWDFGRNWDPDAYAAQPRSLSEIRRDLVMQRNWKGSLDRIKATMAVGCLQVLLGLAGVSWHMQFSLANGMGLCCCSCWLSFVMSSPLVVLLLTQIDGKPLRAELAPITTAALERIKLLLLSMAREVRDVLGQCCQQEVNGLN